MEAFVVALSLLLLADPDASTAREPGAADSLASPGTVVPACTVELTTHFEVHAPTEFQAASLAADCEKYRREIALSWLGGELPPWPQRAKVYFRPRSGIPRGLAWPAHPERGYRDHRVWLSGDWQEVRREIVAHEMAHLVLAEEQLAPWWEEGIASLYDGPMLRESRRERRNFLAWDAFPGEIPRSPVPAEDYRAYCQSSTLVSLALSQTASPRQVLCICRQSPHLTTFREQLGLASDVAFQDGLARVQRSEAWVPLPYLETSRDRSATGSFR